LIVGSHVITATYLGDSVYLPSMGTLSGGQSITPQKTVTEVVSSANLSVFGQAVTFTASVTALPPAAGTPAGTVTFSDGERVLGIGTLSNGQASLTTALLGVGTHMIIAVYNGDANFSTSTSATLNQAVMHAATKTVAFLPNPSIFGQPVILTATVTVLSPGAGMPTGIVTFLEGVTTLGTGRLDERGIATFATSILVAGMHRINAKYGGELHFSISTSVPVSQIINKAATNTMLASSGPATAGQPISFAATVTAAAPGSGTPTGIVKFMDGSLELGVGTLADGQASVTTSELSSGTHMVAAFYTGDTNFNTSTSASLTQTIGEVPITITITIKIDPPRRSRFHFLV
jgi:hypothetical protein